jgi:hypothetical protein
MLKKLPLQRLFGECDTVVADNILTFVFLFSKGFTSSTNVAGFVSNSRETLFLYSPEVKKHQDTNKNL